MLLKLILMGRSADVYAVYFPSIKFHESSFEFQCFQLKEDKSLSFSKPFVFDLLESDQEVCPGLTLQHYIQRTNSLRNPKSIRLFLQQRRPYEDLQPRSIAIDTLRVMKMAEVDTTKFKSHSVRGAAATTASDLGMEVDQVMACARWSSFTTFEVFYNRSMKRKGNVVKTLFG